MNTKFEIGENPYELAWVVEDGIRFMKPVPFGKITKIEIVDEDGCVSVLYNDEYESGKRLYKTKEEAWEKAKNINSEYYEEFLRAFEELKKKGYA